MDDFDLQRFAAGRVARLATVGPDGVPHLVPLVFALAGGLIYSAVDGKPKTTRNLRRLRNIETEPRICLLVDRYDEDWSLLWWVRVDGTATLWSLDAGEVASGVDALIAK